MPDPRDVREVVGRLVFYTDTPVDACWWVIAAVDPEELRRVRMKQKLQLARYARQPFLAKEWEDVDVTVLLEWYRALDELMREEDAVSRSMEDR